MSICKKLRDNRRKLSVLSIEDGWKLFSFHRSRAVPARDGGKAPFHKEYPYFVYLPRTYVQVNKYLATDPQMRKCASSTIA